jgi:hypothetical protein
MLPGGKNLRQASLAVLDAWDDGADRGALAAPIERRAGQGGRQG